MAGQVDRRRHKQTPTEKDAGKPGKPMFRKDGSAIWRARYPDPMKGGPAQIEKCFRTRQDAEGWLAEQTASVGRRAHVSPRDGSRLLRDVAKEWRATWIDLQPKTRAGYDQILRTHLIGDADDPAWFYGAKVADIDTKGVQEFITRLASRRRRETVGHVYNVLRSVLNLAAQRRYIAASPCQGVKLPKESEAEEERVFLTHAEVHALADAITPHYRALVLTAAYTGLRAGELNGLRWKRLDLQENTITVRETLKPVGKKWAEGHADAQGDLVFGPPKTEGSRRTVGIPAGLGVALKEHKLASPSLAPEELVFTAPNGGPNRQTLFYARHFRPAIVGDPDKEDPKKRRAPALPEEKRGCRFHDLRHTCVAFLIEQGVAPLEIARHMGHTNVKTTMNTYGHLYPGAEHRTAAALDIGWQASQQEQNAVFRLAKG